MISKERKFLHNIATPISIIKLTIKKTLTEMESGQFDTAKIIERLKKMNTAVDELQNFHASHKDEISNQ